MTFAEWRLQEKEITDLTWNQMSQKEQKALVLEWVTRNQKK